jgi:hypothetical protein
VLLLGGRGREENCFSSKKKRRGRVVQFEVVGREGGVGENETAQETWVERDRLP